MEESKIIWPQAIFLILAVAALLVGWQLNKGFRRDHGISLWKGSIVQAVGLLPFVFFGSRAEIRENEPLVFTLTLVFALVVIAAVYLYNVAKQKSLVFGLKLSLVQTLVLPGAAIALAIGAAAGGTSRRQRQKQEDRSA